MAVKKVAGGWIVDIQPGGRGAKRIRKTLKTKSEALQFEAWIKTQVAQNGEWAKLKKDTRRLSELIELWFDLHGVQLKRGQQTKQALLNLCEALGNPIAASIDATTFANYRKDRLDGKLTPSTDRRKRKHGISVNSANREHAYLRAMFNELKRIGEWTTSNPIENIRQFKVDERELSFLTLQEITNLLDDLSKSSNRSALLVTKVCLAIGARWSEAARLRRVQIRHSKIHLAKTKSGKVRAIPIAPEFEQELLDFLSQYDGQSTNKDDFLFEECYGAFREAIERTGIDLPQGQLTHVLRHSFASHFVIAGGNILALQRILGHADLKTTMRYAHLSPEHLQESVHFNPLAQMCLQTGVNGQTKREVYTLDALIANRDATEPVPSDMAAWDDKPVGKESNSLGL
jgi:site-specific recombinase XerD